MGRHLAFKFEFAFKGESQATHLAFSCNLLQYPPNKNEVAGFGEL